MNFYIKVSGCQYNEWDAERIRYALKKLGLTESDENNADIYFIIACSVRKSAVDRIFGKIKNWNGKQIILSGCVLDADRKKFEQKGVSIWDSTNNPSLLPSLVGLKLEESTSELLSVGKACSAYLPITIGCNNFCTYCAVPYTRGREISRPFNEVVTDFKKILKQGNREVMLLGQNVNSYKYNFVSLLKTLNDIPGDFTIRFTSNHPKDMTNEIIAAVRDLSKVKKETNQHDWFLFLFKYPKKNSYAANKHNQYACYSVQYF